MRCRAKALVVKHNDDGDLCAGCLDCSWTSAPLEPEQQSIGAMTQLWRDAHDRPVRQAAAAHRW